MIPVYHSGVYPPEPLKLHLNNVNFVPKSGTVSSSGGLKKWVDAAGEELIAALNKKGIHPTAAVPPAFREGLRS